MKHTTRSDVPQGEVLVYSAGMNYPFKQGAEFRFAPYNFINALEDKVRKATKLILRERGSITFLYVLDTVETVRNRVEKAWRQDSLIQDIMSRGYTIQDYTAALDHAITQWVCTAKLAAVLISKQFKLAKSFRPRIEHHLKELGYA